MKKASALREQTDDELRQTFEDTMKELFELRVKRATGDASEQPLRIRSLRREIARIKTVMKERQVKP
jgi:large subunit ribosomal protein L29